MGIIGPTEMALILVVAAIFFFGRGKVIEWVKSFGSLKKELKEAANGEKEKPKTVKKKKNR